MHQRIRATADEKATWLSRLATSSSRAINVSHRTANGRGWRDVNGHSSESRLEPLASWALPSSRRNNSRVVRLGSWCAPTSALLQESSEELAFQLISPTTSPDPTAETGHVRTKTSLVDPASVCLVRLASRVPRVRRAGCRSSECSSALLAPVCGHDVRLTKQRRNGGLFPPPSQVSPAAIRSLSAIVANQLGVNPVGSASTATIFELDRKWPGGRSG